MLKGLQDISHNIIHYGQETRELLANQLGNKDGEGSNIGSQHGEKKSPGGFVFSKTRPHNHPYEFKDETKRQYLPTIPNFTKEHKEECEGHNE